MNVQITKHHVDKENKILEIEIECRTSRSHTEPKLRGSLVFDAGCGRRYFPIVAGNQQENVYPAAAFEEYSSESGFDGALRNLHTASSGLAFGWYAGGERTSSAA